MKKLIAITAATALLSVAPIAFARTRIPAPAAHVAPVATTTVSSGASTQKTQASLDQMNARKASRKTRQDKVIAPKK